MTVTGALRNHLLGSTVDGQNPATIGMVEHCNYM